MSNIHKKDTPFNSSRMNILLKCPTSTHLCLPQSLSHVWLFATPWSLQGSSVHGNFQARILGWGVISFSSGIFLNQGSNLHLLLLTGRFFTAESPTQVLKNSEDLNHTKYFFSGGSNGKESAWHAGDPGSVLGLRASGEKNGYSLQYSCLENSMDREAWWAIVLRLQITGPDWATNAQKYFFWSQWYKLEPYTRR